jgi:hypothetical protein
MNDWEIVLERTCVSCGGSGINRSRKEMRDSCSVCNGYGVERKRVLIGDLVSLLKESVLPTKEEPVAEPVTSAQPMYLGYKTTNSFDDDDFSY